MKHARLLYILPGFLAVSMAPTSALSQPTPVPVPIGTIMAFGGPVDKAWEDRTGWMLCDGRRLNTLDSKTAALFKVISYAWGGDGVTNFNLPNLSGKFLRGVDQQIDTNTNKPVAVANRTDPDRDGRGATMTGGHTGNNVGSTQGDALQKHRHEDQGHNHTVKVRVNAGEQYASKGDDGPWAMTAPTKDDTRSTEPGSGKADIREPVNTPGARPVSVADETRPVNAYIYWIIKYK